MLKVLGKYISESGIDCLFLEAGIYGPTTLGQIMDGKHMKRGIEAYSTMYLAISSFYIKTALENNEVDWLCLPVYRCARGSTSVESFHHHLLNFIPGTSDNSFHFQAYLSKWNLLLEFIEEGLSDWFPN